MTLLLQYTLIFAAVLMLVALGGCSGFVEGGKHEALVIVLWGDVLHC